MSNVQYHYLRVGTEPPILGNIDPFAAVVIIEDEVDWKWRAKISRWLVDSGCLFMMAWGKDCSLWDESVDYANIDDFPDREVPNDRYVLTTWHNDESLEEVFWFAQHSARHDVIKLKHLLLLDISQAPRKDAVMHQLGRSYDLHERESG